MPTWQDLEVFLQLLPRSSTGERMNPYTSLWTGRDARRRAAGVPPRPARQRTHATCLRDEIGRQALRCIRCAACLNVCPVYERTGGHAYGRIYPGPIGAILTPQLVGIEHAVVAAVRLLAVRRLLRGLPGQDRHPDGARETPPRCGAREATSGRGRSVCRSGGRDEGSPALDSGVEGRPAAAAFAPRRASADQAVDERARAPRAATEVVPRLVGPRAPRGERCQRS